MVISSFAGTALKTRRLHRSSPRSITGSAIVCAAVCLLSATYALAQQPADPSAMAPPAGQAPRSLGGMANAGPQARLEITAQHDHDHVVLTIADNGPGVPADALPNLFDPFFRLESARDRASGGTGLGLAIVRTCIESCGGTVTAKNRAGGGLEIQFRLKANAANDGTME